VHIRSRLEPAKQVGRAAKGAFTRAAGTRKGDERKTARRAYERPKRKISNSQKAYGRAFKRLAPKFKKKNGSWKKDGFKRCVRAAHRECRRKH
jgi:hypothetical protein